MSEKQLTTFPDRDGYEQALKQLGRLKIPYEEIRPPARLARLFVPALVMSRESRSRWSEACGGTIACSGWVDYRPFSGTVPAREEAAEPGEDIFGSVSITVLQPCVADDTKVRFIARLGGDIEPVMPYLNAVMQHASYSQQAQTLTYMEQYRMIVLYPRKITVAKADDIVDSWLTLEEIRRRVNRTWAGRSAIQPDYETRKKPPALEIFKRLPQTNCGRCGEMTCMAFALRLWSGEANLQACTPVFEPHNRLMKDALLESCAGLGIVGAQ